METERCIYCMSPSDTDICPHCGKRRSEYTCAPYCLMPGTLLGRKYEIGIVLAEGGFGITYIGRDRDLDLTVAIKEYFPSGIVNRNVAASPEVTEFTGEARAFFEKGRNDFLQEARMLAKFSNQPGIVSVRDFFSENNTVYIVMEYLDGVNLREYLRIHGKLSFAQAYSLLSPVMNVLVKVHAQGLIHRDISPANIMVLKDGGVKLLDFGAARTVDEEGEKSFSVMLKPGYTPEEQYRSKGYQGPWTDIYALSATLYKLVTGETPDNAMNRVYRDEVLPPSRLNGEITSSQDAVIMKGMAVGQTGRYQSMEEMMDACQACLRTEDRTARQDSEEEVTISEELFLHGKEASVKERRSERPLEFEKPSEKQAVWEQPVRKERQEQPVRKERQEQPVREEQEELPEKNRSRKRSAEEEGREQPVREERQEQPEQDKPAAKKPRKICFWLSFVCGLVSLAALVMLVEELAQEYSAPGYVTAYGLFFVLFAGAAVGAGFFYYPRVNHKERKPNYLCLVGSILSLLNAVYMIWSVSASYYYGVEDYVRAGWFTMIWEFFFLAAFFGYFYYPRLTKRRRKRALAIHAGILAAGLAGFICYLVIISLNTVTIGDTNIPKDATSVSLSFDVINNNDIAKLEKLKKMESLSIVGCFLDNEDVQMIGNLTWLKELSLAANTDITDVSPLNQLKNLTYLRLDSTKTEDISCLKDLTALETLRINETNVSDVGVLASYTSLRELWMDSLSELDASTISLPDSLVTISCENDGLENITFMSHLKNLRTVYAAENQISDLSPLKDAEELLEVDFSDNRISDIAPVCKAEVGTLKLSHNEIEDISPLAEIPVRYLYLNGNSISDLSPLTGHDRLLWLYLSENRIADITALKDCFRISQLDLSYNEIQDISALATVDGLSSLNLRSNHVADISPLGRNGKLAESSSPLDLRENEIEKLDALSQFANVGSIYLSGNRITDLSPLAGCKALEHLELDRNLVEDISPLGSLENLYYLTVAGNPVKDLSAITGEAGGVLYAPSESWLYLAVNYDAAIDWQALVQIDRLSVRIYGADERQKENLQKVGFRSFGSLEELEGQ